MSRPRFRLTWEQYEAVIRASFEEGYVQGAAHPEGASVIEKGREIGQAFWKRVQYGLQEKMGREMPDPEVPA